MTIVNVEIKKLDDVQIPHFAHEGDACADIRSSKNITLIPQKVSIVSTGFSMAIPAGYEAQIRPRSGLAAKHGIIVVNSPGTIDSGYRGEVKVIMMNLGDSELVINKGDRIAQIAIRKVPVIEFTEVNELSDTERGDGGFGSTGVK